MGSNMQKNIDDRYNQLLAAQKAQLKSSYDAAAAAYKDQIEAAPETYQELKNEAYTNKALMEKARKESVANMGLAGAGGTSQTIEQRNTNTLLNTLGDAARQQQDYTNEINRALADLGNQYNADLSSLKAQTEAERRAALLSQDQWQADYDMSLRQMDQAQQQLAFSKQKSVYDQAYALLIKRKITKKQFEAMTGIQLR